MDLALKQGGVFRSDDDAPDRLERVRRVVLAAGRNARGQLIVDRGLLEQIVRAHRAANDGGTLTAGVTPIGGRSPDFDKIEAAYVGYGTGLAGKIKVAMTNARRLATIRQTDNVLDREFWLSATPRMKLWLGPKNIERLRAEKLDVVTMPHEVSIEIPLNDLLNDRFGLVQAAILALGDAYGWAIEELIMAMYAAGIGGTTLGTTYDGQNLVDTDHTALSVGGVSQSNYVGGAFSDANYKLAWRRFLGMKDEKGRPINVAGRPITLVVGPANRDIARAIIEAEFGTGGATNLEAGTSGLIVSPWITNTTYQVLGKSITLTGNEWFMVPEGTSAVVVAERGSPERLSVEDGYHRFMTGMLLFGIEAMFGAAYGMWQEVVGGPGS
jgi:phage major head subunit gpT-like protein